MFYKQIILHKGLPFEVTIPNDKVPVSMRTLTGEQIDEELEKGLEDIRAGKTISAEDAIRNMRKNSIPGSDCHNESNCSEP